MAEKKRKVKTGGRPEPLAHPPGLTRSRRRYGCGGGLTKKTA
jgi:hypothetical protein